MKTVVAVVKQQFRIMRHDPWFLLVMFLMPLVVMPLLKQTMGLSLKASGYSSASGAEQVVPGQVVMFGFFVGGSAGFCLFREHGWRTWDRLRASSASSPALLLGFMLPWVVILTVFQGVLLAAGALELGLRFNGGSPIAELAVTPLDADIAGVCRAPDVEWSTDCTCRNPDSTRCGQLTA